MRRKVDLNMKGNIHELKHVGWIKRDRPFVSSNILLITQDALRDFVSL